MDELKDLKELVANLEKADENEIIEIARKILNCFLNNYYIQYGSITINPIVIELYYFNAEKFPDRSVYSAADDKTKATLHARDRQQGNLGKMFLHYNDYGLDICLTDSKNCYLSALIKNAIINDKICSQREIGQVICKHCNNYNDCKDITTCKHNDTVVLKARKESKRQRIIFLPRKGLTKGFKELEFAAIPEEIINEDISKNKLRLATGYTKQWKISVVALNNYGEEEKAKKIANGINGSKIEQEYWDRAVKSWQESMAPINI